jgi:mono/diheme cytochrome c family protein
MRRSWLVWTSLLSSSLGCSRQPAEAIREWQPSDHQQAESADDSRAAPPDEAPTPAETEARVATAIFHQLCAGCHGDSGHGDGASRPPIARIPDVSEADWQSSHTDDAIAQVIVQGRGMMPAFEAQVTPEGVQVLVRHIRRLGGMEADAGVPGNQPSEPTGSAEGSPTRDENGVGSAP